MDIFVCMCLVLHNNVCLKPNTVGTICVVVRMHVCVGVGVCSRAPLVWIARDIYHNISPNHQNKLEQVSFHLRTGARR